MARQWTMLFLIASLMQTGTVIAESLNGFSLDNLSVSRDLVARGGPPRDGIPALTDPDFVPAASAKLDDDDRVLGLARGDAAKAYPIGIMNWHEIVNDRIAGQPVLVTYCPLCYSGMAFDARIGGERRLFGVSGLLYNSDVLLFDRDTESLWSQIAGKAVSGPMQGTELEAVPLAHTTWKDWRARHPDTSVLSRDTGHARSYDHNPYASYEQSRQIMFPVAFRAKGLHPKEKVLGITLNDAAKAYPLSHWPAEGRHRFNDTLDGERITIILNADAESAEARNADGEPIPATLMFWFAWYSFHPDTALHQPDDT